MSPSGEIPLLSTSDGCRSLLACYRDGLLEDTVRFWFPRCVDSEYGGFLHCFDRDGSLLDSDKSVWAQGRMSWMLLTLYNTIERNLHWLAWGEQGLRFIERYCFDNDGRMFFHVTDHGKTWGQPIDFTDQVAGPELRNSFKFVTSGRGIQTRDGMLLHNFVRVGHGVTLFASRDHGESWKAFCEVSPADESKVVQLHDDSLMVNSRLDPAKRFVHRSTDGGLTWQSAADLALPDPRCNACILQYTSKRDGYDKDRLIFCNAASNAGRENLAARISYDGGKTWSDGKVIDRGAASYSEITVLQDGSLGVLYEPGHTEIRFVRFTLEALTGGADSLKRPYALP